MSRISTLGFGTRDPNRPWIEEKVATQSVPSEKARATGIADSRHSTTPGSLHQRQRMVDPLGRAMGDLRIAVTDRRHRRCASGMPEENCTWVPKTAILTFEENAQLVGLFAEHGITKIRITGVEPPLQPDCESWVGPARRAGRFSGPGSTGMAGNPRQKVSATWRPFSAV
jgi:hypothetical protein